MVFFFRKNRSRRSSSPLEPQEIFLDARVVSREDQGMTQLESVLPKEVFIAFFFVVALVLGALLFRVGSMQVLSGRYYAALATQNRQRLVKLAAPRGIIADRFGEALVQNLPRFRLIVHPAAFSKEDAVREEILLRTKDISGVDSVELRRRLDEGLSLGREFVLLSSLSQEAALRFLSDAPQSGLRVELGFERRYIAGPIFAHLLGYTGVISEEEHVLYPDYEPTDFIGKVGIEEAYEGILRGIPGVRELRIDALGKVRDERILQEPAEGKGLLLNIDAGLQRVLSEELGGAISPRRNTSAAAVALDPRDGGVLALVSLPTYDNNLFARGISQEDFSALLNDPRYPLLNRVLAGLYPIGSTIKPFIAAAALEKDILSPWRKIRAPSAISVPHQYNPEIVYTFPDWRDHGFVNLFEALAFSSDVYFYTVGGGYGDVAGLGIEAIAEYLRTFGFGNLSGIDLVGEQAGRIPTPAWKGEVIGEPWYLGDTYHLAIGQGDFSATPLQLAVATSAVANGGIFREPRVVRAFSDDAEEEVDFPSSRVDTTLGIAQETLAHVRRGMRDAVTIGTAKTLQDLPVAVAAKTGTAQFGRENRTHAWVSVFAPYEDPEIVLVVLVEGGEEGSAVAVPIARDVLSWYFSRN